MTPPRNLDPASLPEPDQRNAWMFCLYIAGDAPHSQMALTNLKNICEEFLPGRYQIQIVDVMAHPLEGLEKHIFVTPTLVKVSPLPETRLIGNLSDRDKVIAALGLQT